MGTYFEKPGTTIEWKGLINDPPLDGAYDIAAGMKLAGTILLTINWVLPARQNYWTLARHRRLNVRAHFFIQANATLPPPLSSFTSRAE